MRRVEIAGPRTGTLRAGAPQSRRERVKGLRGCVLLPGQALLLERCRSVHTFGMKVPITVAFLDRDLRVIRVARAGPGRLLLCRRARHVLECHIGADLRVGDVLTRGPGCGAPRSRRRYTLPAAPSGREQLGRVPIV